MISLEQKLFLEERIHHLERCYLTSSKNYNTQLLCFEKGIKLEYTHSKAGKFGLGQYKPHNNSTVPYWFNSNLPHSFQSTPIHPPIHPTTLCLLILTKKSLATTSFFIMFYSLPNLQSILLKSHSSIYDI